MTLGAQLAARSPSRIVGIVGIGVALGASLIPIACKPKATNTAPATLGAAAQPSAAPPAPAPADPSSPSSSAPAEQTPNVPAAPAPDALAAPARAHAGPSELIVGSRRGLEAWSLDGTRHRSISAAPARHPRWLDAQTLLVIAPRDDERGLAKGGKLQRIALGDGRREDVATLPPFACKRGTPPPEDSSFAEYPYEVDLQDDSDFDVAPAAGLACLRLLDRNVNMASVILDVHVDLKSRHVQRWLVTGEDVCAPPRGVRRGEATSSCHGSEEPQAPSEPATTRSYPYDMPRADGVVIQASAQGERPALNVGLDYSPEARSPSGRWLVLGGDTVEGDYLYRRLSLLDRENGRVFPILEKAGAWPAALEPIAGSPPSLALPIESAVLVPGETDLRWLSTAEGELLVVGSTIVRPGLGSFTVDGELAR